MAAYNETAKQREARLQGIRFVRKMLDTALEDAPADVWDDPAKAFDNGRTLALSLRLVRAIHTAGFVMRAHSGGPKIINGMRERLELEDMFDATLIAAGHSSIKAIQQNDQARDRLAEQLWESLHQKHVVLRKVRKPAP
jgi:hypothetical protein